MTLSPCPGCPRFRAEGQYLCPTCWTALPRATRRVLMRPGPGALERLRALHDQITAGVPLHQIHITDTTGPTPMATTSAPTSPTGVHRFLVTADDGTKAIFWSLAAAYSNWIEGRVNRHDSSRETWLVTVMAANGQRFIDAAPDGVTIEEIVSADDTEQYALMAGEPGTGWADGPTSTEQLDQPGQITSPHGTAGLVPPTHHADAPATLTAWVITAPRWHPLWSQYLLSVVTLAPMAGIPDTTIHVPGATHELIVAALNPEHGPYDATTATTGALRVLTPVNIAQQFTATDDRARDLAHLCVRAVLEGRLNPETGDAPERIRAAWAQAIAQTLDHNADPHHGRAN